MMQAKYIVIKIDEIELLFTFSALITHANMLEAVQSVKHGHNESWTRPYRMAVAVSAGFVFPSGTCHGRSESLNLNSRPDVDTKLLQKGCQS